MTTLLWQPNSADIAKTSLSQFMNFVSTRTEQTFQNYQDLHGWSVTKPDEFWGLFAEFSSVKLHSPYTQVVDDPKKMPGASWFTGATINYAEHCLSHPSSDVAVIEIKEDKSFESLTYGQLKKEVATMVNAFRSYGVSQSDRVAAIIPNCRYAISGLLAANSVGAIWSSCSPDFGSKGILDRFSQIEPTVLVVALEYLYNEKTFNIKEKVEFIVQQLPSVKSVIVVPYLGYPDVSLEEPFQRLDRFEGPEVDPKIEFSALPFDHPLYILYSSGTTGKPKSIVHGQGGALIQHLKELMLHCNLSQSDTLFYYTTCGWMMWNWMVSGLAVGATVVCYDGSPFKPDGLAMWQLIDQHKISVFGTSAKYISACMNANVSPKSECGLESLKLVLSTGSPLSEEGFQYIYDEVKLDLQLSSISGGTDIVSCFVLGNPNLPVYSGELQCIGLGMDVVSLDGELACLTAAPSMPVQFWNDPHFKKYKEAYFSKQPNVWIHGDYLQKMPSGGFKILGRSDATLNPGGVRIGTAEIYRVVEDLPEVEDSLVVGKRHDDDEHVVLFVKLNEGVSLTAELKSTIQKTIRKNCTPRHVPPFIYAVSEIPYTLSGKKVELAVKKIINSGDSPQQKDAFSNPEVLAQYFELKKQLERDLI